MGWKVTADPDSPRSIMKVTTFGCSPTSRRDSCGDGWLHPKTKRATHASRDSRDIHLFRAHLPRPVCPALAAPAFPTPELSDLAYPIGYHRYTRAAPAARRNPAGTMCRPVGASACGRIQSGGSRLRLPACQPFGPDNAIAQQMLRGVPLRGNGAEALSDRAIPFGFTQGSRAPSLPYGGELTMRLLTALASGLSSHGRQPTK